MKKKEILNRNYINIVIHEYKISKSQPFYYLLDSTAIRPKGPTSNKSTTRCFVPIIVGPKVLPCVQSVQVFIWGKVVKIDKSLFKNRDRYVMKTINNPTIVSS